MPKNLLPAIISLDVLPMKHNKTLKVCIILLGFSSVLCGLSGPVLADLGNTNHGEMRKVIEEYIKENPEVIRDALMALADREEQASIASGLAIVRLDDGDPVMGNENGNVTVYEFSDYNCGYCKRMFKPVQQLLANNADIRLVVKEFPILSQSSLIAARAGIAAQRQGKFPEFHSEMMSYRGQVSDASINEAARTAGLDVDQLHQDMDSPATSAIIERTRAGAAALKLKGTPALVVGETIIPGAISLEELQNVIDRERAKQS